MELNRAEPLSLPWPGSHVLGGQGVSTALGPGRVPRGARLPWDSSCHRLGWAGTDGPRDQAALARVGSSSRAPAGPCTPSQGESPICQGRLRGLIPPSLPGPPSPRPAPLSQAAEAGHIPWFISSLMDFSGAGHHGGMWVPTLVQSDRGWDPSALQLGRGPAVRHLFPSDGSAPTLRLWGVQGILGRVTLMRHPQPPPSLGGSQCWVHRAIRQRCPGPARS